MKFKRKTCNTKFNGLSTVLKFRFKSSQKDGGIVTATQDCKTYIHPLVLSLNYSTK